MGVERMCKMHRKCADILRLGPGMDLCAINLWIWGRLQAGHGAEGVAGQKQSFLGVPPVEGRGVRENGSRVDEGEVVGAE